MPDAMSTLNTLSAPIQSFTGALPARNEALIGKQAGLTGDYQSRYTGAIKGQESVGDMYGRLGAQQNLPTLTANAANLNAAVFNAPRVATTAVRGNEVNQNQLDRMISGQLAKLSPAAAMATQQAQAAEAEVGKRMGFEQAQQAKELLPYATEKDFLADRLARETTLYTTANEAELNGLMAKLSSGVTLTEGEANRANQLALQEMQYKQAMDVARLQSDTTRYGIDAGTANQKRSDLISLAAAFRK